MSKFCSALYLEHLLAKLCMCIFTKLNLRGGYHACLQRFYFRLKCCPAASLEQKIDLSYGHWFSFYIICYRTEHFLNGNLHYVIKTFDNTF